MSQRQNSEELLKTTLKQDDKRKFGCPCGKRYLSYPALFTHVKQKHDGKAPGDIIKPKNSKVRGRPKLPINIKLQEEINENNSMSEYDFQEELGKVIEGKTIQFHHNFKESQGKVSCNDMASEFIRSFTLEASEKLIIVCFILYMKSSINKKYGDTYWQNNKPNEIIDMSNDFVRNLEQNKQKYPIERQLLIELLFILFRWMYKNKWTDHKLMKKNSESNLQQEEQRSQITL